MSFTIALNGLNKENKKPKGKKIDDGLVKVGVVKHKKDKGIKSKKENNKDASKKELIHP